MRDERQDRQSHGLTMRRTFALLAASLVTAGASALNIVWDSRTPETHRKWADDNFIREQMEVLAPRICKALYEGHEREKLHENFQISLYLAPTRGGAPAYASGRRITWKVGEQPGGDGYGGMGVLCHEMTHVLDMGTDGTFSEAMADWVRNYKVNYHRCTNPPRVLDIRHKALRGGRNYGKYVAGAHFIDFMTQNYGEGTIYRILQGYRQNGKNHWEKTFGKNFDGLIAEWRQMQTIYDPVFQWTYNGVETGVVRRDKGFCPLDSLRAEDTGDKSGAWLNGRTESAVNRLNDGNMTLALHGWFPGGGQVAIASLGTVMGKAGKALLLATSGKNNGLAAYVIASSPGKERRIVSTTAMSVPNLSSKPHSVILTMLGGDAAKIVVDGRQAAKIDMRAKCGDCTFRPMFVLGGLSGGIAMNGISEPRGKGGVRLDDVRVFNRTFRERETKQYATTFNSEYRPAVAATASWCGPQGGACIDDVGNWFCVNSIGEKIFALPTKDTAVTACGKALPSIPQGAQFVCKSFTICGLAIADAANVDLRGVKVVDVEDNSRIITRDGHLIAISALRANRVRLDGKLAVMSKMKIAGNLEMREGARLRIPPNPDMAFVKSISFRGDGPVVLRQGEMPGRGRFQKLMRMDEIPKDLTRFRLNASHDDKATTFKRATTGKYLGVISR